MADVAAKIALTAVFAALGASCTSRSRMGAPRAALADAGLQPTSFVCIENHCEQRYPRFPDDGEWTCSDMGGAAVCSGGDPAAGIPVNVADRNWTCGQEGGSAGTRGRHDRVCVDLAPDFPDGAAQGWRCRYATEEGVTRVCDRDGTAHVIGDPCDARAPCLDGLRCLSGRCTPDAPSPSCILDADCDGAVCRFGSCWHGPT